MEYEKMPPPKGRIIDIQHFSLHDGPGTRTTVFFKGCPLRCDWCANPDSQARALELVYSDIRCVGCGACVDACAEGLIRLEDTVRISREACTGCGACVDACPGGAMRFSGYDISLNDVLEEIEKERNVYRNSGGGVTLSGGEPLAQPDFARAILEKCRKWGIHTAIETAGYVPYDTLARVSAVTDLIYFDVKSVNPVSHLRHTRVENPRILTNLKKISRTRPGSIIVRAPLIPGLNDTDHDLKSLGEFIVNETSVTRVELLNYHNLGLHKYAGLGRSCALAPVSPLSGEAFAKRAKWFSRAFPTLTLSYHV
ncbi:MAG: glycyl-radical enzyme activating protein [Desulfobacter sp.]